MLEIRLLGQFDVRLAGQPVRVPEQAAQSLLAYLLLNPGLPQRREKLAGLFWPDAAEASARSNLRHALWRVRKALGLCPTTGRDYVLADEFTVMLDPQADLWLDTQVLDQPLDEAAPLAALLSAAGVYRGELLPGFYDNWVTAERERLQAAFEGRMALLMDKLTEAERWSDILDFGERWIALGGVPEPAYRALMRAHAAQGNQSQVAATFRRCADALQQELGVAPSEQTRALYAALVQGPAPAPLPEVVRPEPAQGTLRGYELRECLGRGAFGAVYRAYQPGVERWVAVKAILAEHADRPDFIRRFEVEAQLIARLEHPHIVPLYDYWREPGGAYLVMRYLRGGNLRSALRPGGWPAEMAAGWLDQMASALAAAHRLGILHCDIKPENILLDEAGNAYLSDFGIAQEAGELARAAAEAGRAEALSYVSPERRQGQPATVRGDLYALALVLDEVLAGTGPVVDTTSASLTQTPPVDPIRDLRLRRPDLPEALIGVLQQALAPDPAERFADALAFASAFRRALSSEGGPAAVLAPTAAAAREVTNPYKGLRAFQEADAADFFGREVLIERLVARLCGPEATRFLAVVGPSGSGKSSAVRAGLVPALRRGALPGSERWFIVEMLPGAYPLEELEAALLRIAVNPPETLIAQLREDERGLMRAVKRALPDDGTELLLLVDQFEELFTLTADEAVRRHFLDSLRVAVADPHSRVRVVICLRADFYDRPLLVPDFSELMRRHSEVVVPLTVAELTGAIRAPAERLGVGLQPGLMELILGDVKQQPGALPMLQYSLTELFERREGTQLTRQAYAELGGVAGALTQRAEAVFASLDEAGQVAAQQVFLRLVTLGEGAEDTRRRVLRSELVGLADAGPAGTPSRPGRRRVAPTVDAVIDAFGRHRLLTFDRDPATRRPTVEVAHEAVLRQWPRLQRWLDESRADVRQQRLLGAEAAQWSAAGREPSYLLAGARLEQFEGWAATSAVALTQDEWDYLDGSLAERDRRAAEQEARRARELALEKRARRVLQALVGVLLAAAVVAGGLAWWANVQRQAATAARQEAVANLAVSDAQRLAAEANRLFIENRDYETAALLALRSLALHYTPQGDEALSRATRLDYPVREFYGHTGDVRQIALSADGKWMVSGDGSGTPILWDVTTGQIRQQLKGHTVFALSAAISPDGRVVATGSDDGTLRVWDAATGQQLYWRDYGAGVWGVDISADGRYLFVGGWDKVARLLDLATGAEIRTYPQTGAVLGTALSPDGRLALTGTDDGLVHLWDVKTGQERLTLKLGGWPWGFAFAPDMSTFAVVRYEKVAYIYETQTGKQLYELPHTDELFEFTAYSPDGRYILTGDTRGAAHLWDVQTGLEARRFLHSTSVSGGAFTPDGRYLVTGAYDKVIRFWDLGKRPIQTEINGAGGTEAHVAFTSNGQSIFAQGKVFDIHTGEVQVNAYPGNVGISADGRTAYDLTNNQLHIFDTSTWSERLSLTPSCVNSSFGIGIAPDGSVIALGSFSAPYRICLLDTRTGQVLRTIDVTTSAWGLAFSPDGRLLAAGTGGATTHLFDVATGAELRTMTFPGTPHWVNDVAFSPDGRYLLSAGTEDKLWLWDVQTGAKVQAFVGHTGVIWGAAFSPDGRYIASSGADGTARLWDVATGKELRRFGGHTATVYDIAFSPDGSLVATVSSDGTAKLWQTNLEGLKSQLCAILTRDLSAAERERYNITDSGPTCAGLQPAATAPP